MVRPWPPVARACRGNRGRRHTRSVRLGAIEEGHFRGKVLLEAFSSRLERIQICGEDRMAAQGLPHLPKVRDVLVEAAAVDLRVSLGVALSSVVVAVDARGFHGGTFNAAGAEASLRFFVEEHSRN